MVADGNGAFAKAAGLELDLTGSAWACARSLRDDRGRRDGDLDRGRAGSRQADVSGAESVLARL